MTPPCFNAWRKPKPRCMVHPSKKVHFRDAGAVDFIADIVGACFAFDALGVAESFCSKVIAGSGTVKIAATGFGAGTKDFVGHTNLLRVLIADGNLAPVVDAQRKIQ